MISVRTERHGHGAAPQARRQSGRVALGLRAKRKQEGCRIRRSSYRLDVYLLPGESRRSWPLMGRKIVRVCECESES